MPTPSKTSAAAIVQAARDLIAEHGPDALTMQSVAHKVGVRGPSLYRHFSDRTALLEAVELTVVADLENVIKSAAPAKLDDKDALRAIATAFRNFARQSPAQYRLIFQLQSAGPAAEEARRNALQPAFDHLTSLLGDPGLAFVRARALTAFLHGFASMETGGAFRMGGTPVEHRWLESLFVAELGDLLVFQKMPSQDGDFLFGCVVLSCLFHAFSPFILTAERSLRFQLGRNKVMLTKAAWDLRFVYIALGRRGVDVNTSFAFRNSDPSVNGFCRKCDPGGNCPDSTPVSAVNPLI